MVKNKPARSNGFAVVFSAPKCDIDSVKTGQRFRAARERVSLKQDDVANRMGISPAYLSELERGRRNWSWKLVDLAMLALAGEKGKP